MHLTAILTHGNSKDDTDSERDPPSSGSFVVRHQGRLQNGRSKTDSSTHPTQPSRALERILYRGHQDQSADMPCTVSSTLSS
jgi:hypothetical protein